MAMAAQIFPVAAVGRIIMMVAIPVVDGQQVQTAGIEFTAALGTDRAMDFQ